MNQTSPVTARAPLIVDLATLLASTMSAMRNPALYDDPDRFDFRRDHPLLHPVFGNGPHRCIGKILARLEMLEGPAALIAAPSNDLRTSPRITGSAVSAKSHRFRSASVSSNEIRAQGGGLCLPLCISQQTGAFPMQISSSTHGDIRILAVSGRINLYSAGSFYDALVEAVGDAQADLVIDLTAITRLTSAGMRGFVVAAKLQQSAGHAIRICGATAAIEKFLRGRGYDNLLRFEPTVEDSIKALSPAYGERAADMAQGVICVRPLSAHPLDNADAGLTVDHILQVLHHENAQFFTLSRRLAPEGDGADLLQTNYPAVGRHLTRA